MKNDVYIHSSAIVEKNVKIGKGSFIWHHCHIRNDAKLGSNVSLGKGVYIDINVDIGKGCRIQNGVSVYHGVHIKDWVFVGPNVTFTNDRLPRAGSKKWKISETNLMPGCSIGAGSIIVCDVTIGSFALIGAASVVTENIPSFHLAYGLPAKIISKICACAHTKIPLEASLNDCIQKCCKQNLKNEVLILAKKEIKRLTKNEKN